MAKRINSRQKGAAGEREAAKVLNELFGLDARRGVQFQGGPDSPDVAGLPGVHVEVKRVQALNITAAMEKCVEDAGAGTVPMVLHRKNKRPWLVTVRLADVPAFAAKAVLRFQKEAA